MSCRIDCKRKFDSSKVPIWNPTNATGELYTKCVKECEKQNIQGQGQEQKSGFYPFLAKKGPKCLKGFLNTCAQMEMTRFSNRKVRRYRKVRRNKRSKKNKRKQKH